MATSLLRWHADLTRRERFVVAAGLLAVVTAALSIAIIAPLDERIGRARVRHADALATLALLAEARQAVTQVRAVRADGAQMAPGQTLLATLNETARAARLSDAIRRITPSGDASANLVIGEVEFDRLVAWLIRLSDAFGIRVSQVTVTAATAPGRVSATLTLVSDERVHVEDRQQDREDDD